MPELRNGTPRRTPLGLPRPISGAFGDVYEFTCGQRRYAVKLFTKGSADQQQRYTAISAHLSEAKLAYIVSFNYIPQASKSKGLPYPVLKMEWVQGEPINQYVEKHLNAADLSALVRRWADMIDALEPRVDLARRLATRQRAGRQRRIETGRLRRHVRPGAERARQQ